MTDKKKDSKEGTLVAILITVFLIIIVIGLLHFLIGLMSHGGWIWLTVILGLVALSILYGVLRN